MCIRDSFAARAADLVASACKIGFEGVIGKRADAPYRSGRSSQWIKLKCSQRQEFVVGGFTEPQGGRSGLPEFDTKLRKLLICIGRAFRPATTTGAFERRGRVS